MTLWRQLASVAAGLALQHALADDVPLGEWATQGSSARVQIRTCAHAADRLCGTIVWLWEPFDKRGHPMTDSRNADPTKRGMPLIGLQLLSDFSQGSQPGTWMGGSIYNPEDGRTYSATMRLRGLDVLEVEGCVLFLCSRQVWRRLPASCTLASSDLTQRF